MSQPSKDTLSQDTIESACDKPNIPLQVAGYIGAYGLVFTVYQGFDWINDPDHIALGPVLATFPAAAVGALIGEHTSKRSGSYALSILSTIPTLLMSAAIHNALVSDGSNPKLLRVLGITLPSLIGSILVFDLTLDDCKKTSKNKSQLVPEAGNGYFGLRYFRQF